VPIEEEEWVINFLRVFTSRAVLMENIKLIN
jgi:hypothetical protein